MEVPDSNTGRCYKGLTSEFELLHHLKKTKKKQAEMFGSNRIPSKELVFVYLI